MSSLHRGLVCLLCIVPIAHNPLEVEGEFRKSRKLTATMQRARGDEDDVEMTSGTYLEGELVVRRTSEESFFTFLLSDHHPSPFVKLLRDHGKDDQADLATRGELMKLFLSYCRIGDDGAEIVAEYLKRSETVSKVYLWSCNIGLRGVKAIAEVLKHSRTIKHLSVGENQLGDESAEELINVLRFNLSLVYVNLWDNNVAPESMAVIEYLTTKRNKILIPAAVRRAALCLIAARHSTGNAGNLASFPKEIVRMIAVKVCATRKDPIWIAAVSNAENLVRQKEFVDKWVQDNLE